MVSRPSGGLCQRETEPAAAFPPEGSDVLCVGGGGQGDVRRHASGYVSRGFPLEDEHIRMRTPDFSTYRLPTMHFDRNFLF